jgi:DNA (cytosine-5)-methyltransferase 1
MIQILELFGGIGSPRKALINLGVPVKAIDYVEIDEKAVRSYNAIFSKELKYKAQTVVGYSLKPDILIHGSPCQDFSIAGRQQGADEGTETRSSLMWETLNIIKQMGIWKPRIVIWENVKNVLSKHMLHNFNGYLDEMQKLGYQNSFEILNAMDFGLPQNRERVFTVSLLAGSQFDFKKLERTQSPHITMFLQSNRQVDKSYTVTTPSLISAIGKKSVIRRMPIIENFCYTITERQDRAPNSGVIDIGNGQYRYLTELECWRLQGYSDEDFEAAAKVNSRRTLYKQAGNSIPVTIFESIFKQLKVV